MIWLPVYHRPLDVIALPVLGLVMSLIKPSSTVASTLDLKTSRGGGTTPFGHLFHWLITLTAQLEFPATCFPFAFSRYVHDPWSIQYVLPLKTVKSPLNLLSANLIWQLFNSFTVKHLFQSSTDLCGYCLHLHHICSIWTPALDTGSQDRSCWCQGQK